MVIVVVALVMESIVIVQWVVLVLLVLRLLQQHFSFFAFVSVWLVQVVALVAIAVEPTVLLIYMDLQCDWLKMAVLMAAATKTAAEEERFSHINLVL